MIISVSYKTDIPAFYGSWFMNRLRAGYCKMVNPYGHQIMRVSLEPAEVDGFVFWTRNIAPFIPHLSEIKSRGYPFMVQYGNTAYPKALESCVVDARRGIERMRRIGGEYGPRVAVWRYDPIVISSLTPIEFHLANFEWLCSELRGATDEVVISFMQVYEKTRRNLNGSAKTFGFQWSDPTIEGKRQLAGQLVAIARAHDMRLSVCSQWDYLVEGAQDAHCIDAGRLADIAGRPILAPLHGGRKQCGCHASRDIGEYDTCPHGCVYCYAVNNHALAQRRFKAHDPESEFLFPPTFLTAVGAGETLNKPRTKQLPLFGNGTG